MRARIAGLLLFCACALSNAQADDTHFTVESEALTNGWFQYRLSGSWNAFFTNFYDVALAVLSSNFDAVGLTDGATVTVTNEGIELRWPGTAPRQYDHLVTAHSAEAYITTNSAYALFAAYISGWGHSPILSGNIVGYTRQLVLVPSPVYDPSITSSYTFATALIIPDPKIVGLTPQTLSIEWYTNSTMRIEATRDLVNWSNVATILHFSPVSTWTSPVPLEVYGSQFRVVLIANFQDTNLLSGSSAGRPATAAQNRAVSPPDVAPIVKLAPSSPGRVAVTFAGTPGATYTVSLVTDAGAALDAATVTAIQALTTVELNDAGTSAPVLVRALRQ